MKKEKFVNIVLGEGGYDSHVYLPNGEELKGVTKVTIFTTATGKTSAVIECFCNPITVKSLQENTELHITISE